MAKIDPNTNLSDLSNKVFIARVKGYFEFDDDQLNVFSKVPFGWNSLGQMNYLHGKYVLVEVWDSSNFQVHRHEEFVKPEDRSSSSVWLLSHKDVSDIWEIKDPRDEQDRSEMESVIGDSLEDLKSKFPWIEFINSIDPIDVAPEDSTKIQLEPVVTKSHLEKVRAAKLTLLLDVYAQKPKYHASKIRAVATEIKFIDNLLEQMK